MSLSLDTRRAILGIGGGIALFYILLKVFATKGQAPGTGERPADEDIQKALLAYKEAATKGEDADFLKELNDELSVEFGVRVYADKKGGYTATDLNGKELKSI